MCVCCVKGKQTISREREENRHVLGSLWENKSLGAAQINKQTAPRLSKTYAN